MPEIRSLNEFWTCCAVFARGAGYFLCELDPILEAVAGCGSLPIGNHPVVCGVVVGSGDGFLCGVLGCSFL